MVADTNTTDGKTSGDRTSWSGGKSWRATGESVSATAAGLGAQVRGEMNTLLQGQMAAGADYVHMVSGTAHSFANDLESKAPELARYMHRAADRADQFAEDFRHRSPNELINVATDYARRNPRVFFGGAIALGFVLSRFLKSGSDDEQSHSSVSSNQPAGRRSMSSAAGASSKREFGQQAREDSSREDFSNAR